MFRSSMAKEEKSAATATATETGSAVATPPPAEPTPDAVELKERDHRRYEFVEEHARGGLGRVMRSRDLDLGREVAIKEILVPTGAAEARFVREAMITARLEHPGIVPVHDAGRWPNGTPFYAMKFVSGRPLKDLILEAESLEQRLRLLPHVIAITDAIAYAHSRRVLHRDLKPSNVIVGSYGETVVIDWGLAKDLDSDEPGPETGLYRSPPSATLTATGAILGTPAYMAPEQALGRDAMFQTDVYALGAILFQVLTGEAPFARQPSQAILERLSQPGLDAYFASSPPALGARARVPDLLAIALKAMAARPEDRYPSAEAFGSDLRRFTAGQLVSAYSYSPVRVLKKWAARHRSLVVLAAASTLVIAVLSALGLHRIFKERDRALEAETHAQHERDTVYLTQAESSLKTDPTATIAWLKKLPGTAAATDKAHYLARDAISRGVAQHVLAMSPRGLSQLARSRDGAVLVVSDSRGDVRVLDGVTLREQGRLKGQGAAPIIIDSSTGTIVTADATGTLVVLERGHLLPRTVRAHHKVPYLGYLVGSTTVVTAGLDGDVRATDLVSGESRILVAHRSPVRALDVSRDGLRVVSGSDNGLLAVTELATKNIQLLSKPSKISVDDVDFLPDGGLLSIQGDGSITRWDPMGRPLRTLHVDPSDADHLRVSSEARFAYVCGSNGKVTRLDTATLGTYVMAPVGIGMTNSALAATPFGDVLAVAYADGLIRYWFTAGLSGGELRGHSSSVSALTITPTATAVSIVSVDLAGLLRTWELAPPPSRLLKTDGDPILSLAWNDDRQLLAAAGHGNTVSIMSLDGALHELPQPHESIQWLSWLEHGDYLVLSSVDGTATILETTAWTPVAEVVVPVRPTSISVSEDSTIDFLANETVYRWTPPYDHLSTAQAPEPVAAMLTRVPEGQAVLTTDMHVGLMADSGAFNKLPPRIRTVFGKDLLLEQDASHLSVVQLPTLRALLQADAPYDIADAAYFPFPPTLYLFSADGTGTIAGHSDGALHSTRATLDLLPTDAAHVVRVTPDGCVERWSFDRAEVDIIRLVMNGAISARGLISDPGLELAVGTRKGQVWVLDLAAAQLAWDRQSTLDLRSVSDYEIDGEAFRQQLRK